MQMPYWVQSRIIITRNRDNDISSTKVISFAMAKINVNDIIFQINLDVSAYKNFLNVNLLSLRNCTRFAEKTEKGDKIGTPQRPVLQVVHIKMVVHLLEDFWSKREHTERNLGQSPLETLESHVHLEAVDRKMSVHGLVEELDR
jgi:hypothetical protein